MPWSPDSLPDLSDRDVVVTGANGGLGLEAARMLAARGARVVLACRNVEKGEAAAAGIRTTVPAARLDVEALDLSSLASIRACAERLRARLPAIHALVNNAGIMAIPRSTTEDGFETQLGTNHLGHFALTGLLLDRLEAGAPARVVSVASSAHWIGRVRFDDLNAEKSYQRWLVYGQSKLANLLFTFELQRRLERRASGVVAVACHPGYASTNLQFVGPQRDGSRFGEWFMGVGSGLLAQSAERGALPTVYAAAAPEVAGGDYIGPDGFMELGGYPRKVGCSAAARDEAVAARLWEVSEAMTGVSYLS